MQEEECKNEESERDIMNQELPLVLSSIKGHSNKGLIPKVSCDKINPNDFEEFSGT